MARVPQLRTIRRYFTLTRRKNAAGASAGVAIAFLGLTISGAREVDNQTFGRERRFVELRRALHAKRLR